MISFLQVIETLKYQGMNLYLRTSAVSTPPHLVCSGFLPEGMRTAAPGTILYQDSASSPQPLSAEHQQKDAEMQEVIDQFQEAYPDIIFEADWDDSQVNAVSWIDNSGQMHVKAYGGILHSKYVESEGLSLVLAHEVGHLLGGPPYHEGRTRVHPFGAGHNNMSAEGQADYYGASVVMRNMADLYGYDYETMTTEGIDQLHNLFHYGIEGASKECNYPPDGVFASCHCPVYLGCDYPPVDCRIETYVDAEKGEPKPVCAGPIEHLYMEIAV